MARIFLSLLLAAVSAGLVPAWGSPRAGEEEIEFTPRNGEAVTGYRGAFTVPENRADPDSRMIEIGYVRFPATTDNPGSPIIYLAGGPGGSGTGTARGNRFPLFMAMRQHGDVYAFDQRGTGLSDNDMPACRSGINAPQSMRVGDAEWADLYQQAANECALFWEGEGIDLNGYTTLESVGDLEALRQHIGAEQLSLWGISYGSHLALAAINQMDDRLDRVIIASAEGLDQTVKLPEYTLAYFGRLQEAIDTQPLAAAAYPDVVGLMTRVHNTLDAQPMALDIPQADGSTVPFLLQRHHLQQFAGGLLADPDGATILLPLYASLDAGESRFIIALIQRFVSPGETISFRPMPLAMDRASGITPARLEQFNASVAQSPIGAYLNAPMPQLLGFMPELDLGDAFRTQLAGDTPVLLLTGTLDGRTLVEGQAEAVLGLSNVTQVTIINAGHNLFMTSEEVHQAMHRFMRDEPVGTNEIRVNLPDFMENPFQ